MTRRSHDCSTIVDRRTGQLATQTRGDHVSQSGIPASRGADAGRTGPEPIAATGAASRPPRQPVAAGHCDIVDVDRQPLPCDFGGNLPRAEAFQPQTADELRGQSIEERFSRQTIALGDPIRPRPMARRTAALRLSVYLGHRGYSLPDNRPPRAVESLSGARSAGVSVSGRRRAGAV